MGRIGKTNSRQKGKRGELEAAELIRKHGFAARRGQQFKGGGDSPDVVTDIDGYHFEIKRTETLSVYLAVAQAQHDAAPGEVPVVLHRKNKKDWLAILPADDFLRLVAREKLGGLLDEL